jgi:hypothetical protein
VADQESLAQLHYELIKELIERGTCPSVSTLAQKLNVDEKQAEFLLEELASIHGLVLHPHARAPWIVHPFSLTPTINWISGETKSWWAPCLWCAFGVAVLVGGRARIYSRYGAEAEPLIIEVDDGRPVPRDNVVVHFAIPPSRAWDNVHQHCSLVLPFHSPQHVSDWCNRYGLSMGEVVPLQTVADLAQAWYGTHASPQWRKWTVEQAQEIFSRIGLISDFWRLQPRQGRF